jgi:periplasmic protein TonB
MRRSFTLVSAGAHAIVMAAVLLTQLLADSAIPTPHRPLLFDNVPFIPVDVQLAKPRVAPRATTDETVSTNAAPVIAPAGIAPETQRDRDPSPRSIGMIPGVETGPPSAIVDGVGGTGIVAPPPPPVTAPVRLHSGMKAPVKIVHVAPVYPAIAQGARVQGVVILEAVLDAKGRVDSVRVLRSIPLLDQAALDAVQQWRFTPALLNGQAVPVVMTVTVNFTLQDR